MAVFKIGNLWDAPVSDALVITTNACLKDNLLVMGAGVALQAYKRYKGLEREFGEQLTPKTRFKASNNFTYILCEDYYMLTTKANFRPALLALQTKRRWDRLAELDLIGLSLDFLIAWSVGFEAGAGRAPLIYLPYPGVGQGGLSKNMVKPLLDVLPDNFIVWSLT